MELNSLPKTDSLESYTAEVGSPLEVPYFEDGVSAGFPSPSTDYLDAKFSYLTSIK